MNNVQKIHLEVFEQHEEVTYYTIRYDGETYSEVEKFIIKNSEDKKLREDLHIISRKLERIGRSGCEERHVRNAGKKNDDVCALPEYGIFGCKLRLYAIRISRNIVILGNGGKKTTKTYNEDPFLNSCVETLQQINYKIKNRVRYNKISINLNSIEGNLIFQL